MRSSASTLIFLAAVSATVAAQTPQSPSGSPPPAVVPAEAAPLAQGWAALAAGDLAAADARAGEAMARDPRSAAAAALAIDVAIARGGAAAGLQTYEQWLGARALDDGYLLRRVARAALKETTRRPAETAGSAALEALVADGDQEAIAESLRGARAGAMGSMRVMAALGHPDAVRNLLTALKSRINVQATIEALVESRSPLAIDPLIALLKDAKPEHQVWAAEALGAMNAKQAAGQLRTLLTSQSAGLRLAAAGALYKMGDFSGMQVLQAAVASEVAHMRLSAAKVLASNPDGNWRQIVGRLVQDPDPVVRAEAARLLAPYDLDVARSVLGALLTDPNPAVVEMASRSYARHVAADFRSLRGMLRSNDSHVRTASAGRILELTR